MKENTIINIPNTITTLRMLLVIPTVYFLINDLYIAATALFIIAAISDVIDGFLAKKLNQITKFGTILDPIADKILINYTIFIFTIKNDIPQFLFFIIFTKDIILIIGSTAEIFSQKDAQNTKIKASIFGKISTFFQVLLILFILIYQLKIYINNTLIYILVWTVAVSSIIALLAYTENFRKIFKGANI